jgi:hypothetical protein
MTGQINIDVIDRNVDISPYPCSPAKLKYPNKTKTTKIIKKHLIHGDLRSKYTYASIRVFEKNCQIMNKTKYPPTI